MEVNVLGAVRVTKGFLPLLRKSKDSRVINMGSLAGKLGSVTEPDLTLHLFSCFRSLSVSRIQFLFDVKVFFASFQ